MCVRAPSPALSIATARARSNATPSRPYRNGARRSAAGRVALRDHAPGYDIGRLHLIPRGISLLHGEQRAGVLPVLAARGENILIDIRIALRRTRRETVTIRQILGHQGRRGTVLGPGWTSAADEDEDSDQAGESFHAFV